jgi:hypothetical protein
MMGPACPTAHTFYRLRRELIEVLGVDRREVRPSTRLDDLIPAGQRRAVWKHLRKRGLRLPDLCLPPRVLRTAVTGMAVGAALLGTSLQTLLALFAILRLGWVIWLVSRCFPADIDRCGPVTVRDAVLYLTPFKEYPGYRWSHAEISTKVRLIISTHLRVPLEDVRPESRFVEDLGSA